MSSLQYSLYRTPSEHHFIYHMRCHGNHFHQPTIPCHGENHENVSCLARSLLNTTYMRQPYTRSNTSPCLCPLPYLCAPNVYCTYEVVTVFLEVYCHRCIPFTATAFDSTGILFSSRGHVFSHSSRRGVFATTVGEAFSVKAKPLDYFSVA